MRSSAASERSIEMATAASMQSLMSAPPYRGLEDYPGLAMRSRQTTDDYVQNTMADVSNPWRFMQADQAMQAGVSPWAPFYQRRKEQGITGVRFSGYNPKADAAKDAARQGMMYASASKAMPFTLPVNSFPPSVRSLYGDEGTALL